VEEPFEEWFCSANNADNICIGAVFDWQHPSKQKDTYCLMLAVQKKLKPFPVSHIEHRLGIKPGIRVLLSGRDREKP
jgi:hypothetical protein